MQLSVGDIESLCFDFGKSHLPGAHNHAPQPGTGAAAQIQDAKAIPPSARGPAFMMLLSTVDLPAPLRPSNATSPRGATSSVTRCSTWLSP